MKKLLERADLMAALFEQIADHLRQYPEEGREEDHLGIGHIIRQESADEWEELAKWVRHAAKAR